jgi:hypothetical protein
LRQADEQRSGINEHTRQTDLLSRKETGNNKERRQEAHRHPKIGDDGASDALLCYYAHGLWFYCVKR